MREFLSILIMPLSIFWILIILSGVMVVAKRKKAGKVLLLVAGCWLLVISTRFVPDMLAERLENKYKPFTEADFRDAKTPVNVIVLGAGHSDDKRLSANNQLSSAALGRLVEGIRIYKRASGDGRQASGVKLIVSGYAGRLKITQAEVLYRTAVMLGIDSTNIVMSPLPSNTREEAAEYVKRFGKENSLIVVTDAIHMPRAVMLFKKAGVKVIPAPTNFLVKQSTAKNPFSWMPGAGNVSVMEATIHEYAGIVWARIGE